MFFTNLIWLVFALLSLRLSHAAFVEVLDIEGVSKTDFLLDPFVVDVALDDTHNILKFFINTQVKDRFNATTSEVLIDDVNLATNRYTTFHVEIDFMGKTFILENLRFCQMVSVKNTSGLYPSERYPLLEDIASLSSSSSQLALPTRVVTGHEGYVVLDLHKRHNLGFNTTAVESEDYIATSNSTIEAFYSNATGDLVQCPLYQNDSIVIYYQADISDHRQALGSYNVKFTVVSNDEGLDVIGASETHVTPVLHPRYLSSILKYSVLVIILLSGAINYCITIVSPDQESSNPFLVEASTICNAQLLRELEASTNVIVRYFQFAFFAAGLDLQYPGFFQPFIGQTRWCCLLGLNVFSSTAVPLMESDNIFITLHWSGLGALALYGSSNFIAYSWANFIICLVVCIGATVAIHQFFIMLKLYVNLGRYQRESWATDALSSSISSVEHSSNRRNGLYSISKNAWALMGHVLRQFLHTFELAFLVLTFFMFYAASDSGRKMFLNQAMLMAKAFDPYFPYAYLTFNAPPSNSRLVGDNSGGSGDDQSEGIPNASIICGALLMFAWLSAKLYFVFKYLVTVRGFKFSLNNNVTRLYTEIKSVLLWAYFYNFYLPNKSYYAIFDFIALLLQLIIIGLLQMNGTVQVALLIVLEVARLILLLTIKPFYLKLTWHSLNVVTQVSRILVLTLSISFIKVLGIAEAPRTYVAYVQLVIHLLVVLFFIGHLVYCVVLTVMSYFSAQRKKNYEKSLLGANPSKADYMEDFEYYPINYRNFDVSHDEIEKAHVPETSESFDGLMGDEEDVDYYRAHSDKILQKSSRKAAKTPLSMKAAESGSNGVDDDADDNSCNVADYQLRRRRNDYATREGDLIYEKFFSSSDMDPEIRKLWASRMWNMDANGSNAYQSNTRSMPVQIQDGKTESWTDKILYATGVKKKPSPKGFEVFRPNKQIMSLMKTTEANESNRADTENRIQ